MVTMYFLRHANTEGDVSKIFEDWDWQTDLKRNLTPKGRQQTQSRREQLGNPVFDLCIVSPAERCRQTARLLLGDSPDVESIEVPSLYPSPEGKAGKLMWESFKKLMYAPLSVHLQSEAAQAISENGKANATAIRKIIAGCSHKPQRILIVDHAITLQATGQEFTTDKEIFTLKVGEVEGFKIDVATKKATVIKDPEPVS